VAKRTKLVLVEEVESRILRIRDQKVILDADLAFLYGTTTKRLNEQVKRNRSRFPSDFMFQLSSSEKAEVVAKCDHLAKLKYSPSLPFVFTEHGAIMAASVLSTERAIEVSVVVVRTFVKIREWLAGNQELSLKLSELESKVDGHDEVIRSLVSAIRELMSPPPARRKSKIGFRPTNEDE
jgi:ORF6N domain